MGSFSDDEQAMSRQSVSPDEGHTEENEKLGSRQFRMDPDVAGEQHQYETMHHPTMSGQQPHMQEEYIKMVPAVAKVMTMNCPAVQSNYDVPAPFRRRSTESPASSSASPSNYENAGGLPTIKEAPKGRMRGDIYENVGAADLRDKEFTHCHPNYKYASFLTEHRRNRKTYQNVTLIDEDHVPSFRSRTQGMEKGQFTPPRNKNPHLHYAQRQSPSDV